MTPFIMTPSAIAIFPVGVPPIQLDSSHLNFAAVQTALKAGNIDEAIELASVTAFVQKVSGGLVEVSANGVTYKGAPLSNYLTTVMTRFFTEGLPVQHFVNFLVNLMDNPSRTAIQELYLFLEGANLPITEDGCFLAYKAVRHDFRDKYSGKCDNSPGQVLDMPRREVDDNRDRTCSYGYHAAAYDYAKNFLGSGGDRMVVVKINPRDVVSVPSDYQNQKLRMCHYEVMYEIPGAFDTLSGRLHSSQVSGAKDNEPELQWWEQYSDDVTDPDVVAEQEAQDAEEARIRNAVESVLDDAFDELTDRIVDRLV